jgi:hypothetical protein
MPKFSVSPDSHAPRPPSDLSAAHQDFDLSTSQKSLELQIAARVRCRRPGNFPSCSVATRIVGIPTKNEKL